MATFTITTPVNIDSLASKAGGDTYTINGGTLTIDQDSRYGLNQGATTGPLGAITISSTLGGSVVIDGRYVRLIPFNSGSGNVPASNTVISQGGVTGKLIGVWGAITAAPTAAGAAMPASGFIKVKQVSQVPGYAAGALTGISATATGEDVAGWIEIVGDESKTATIPRLGDFSVAGDWFDVGTTSGINTTTYQLPTSGSAQYFAGVFVEATTGQEDYEFYPCMGSLVGANYVDSDPYRGKVCWISSTGVLRLGYDGTNSNGYLPPSGRKIVIPNVLLVNCTTAARGVNASPNASLGNRYDFTTTGGGAIAIDKALCSWAAAFARASTLTITNSGINEQLYLDNIGGATTLATMGIGQSAAQTQSAFYNVGGSGGIEMTDCVWCSNSAHVFYMADVSNLQSTRSRTMLLNGDSYYLHHLPRCRNLEFVSNVWVAGYYSQFLYCSDVTISDLKYASRMGAGRGRHGVAIFIDTVNTNFLIDGISLVADDAFPSSRLIQNDAYSNVNLDIRNIGSFGTPFNCGGIMSNLLYSLGTFASNIKLRRVWFANAASNILPSPHFTTNGVQMDNIYRMAGTSDYVYSAAALNQRLRGIRTTSPMSGTPSALAYGTHWHDFYYSDSAGLFRLEMNEPSAATAGYISLSNGARFTGVGGLYMPTVGMSATFEMDYFSLGHTGFSATAASMEGGTASNYTFRYQIDKNDGGGFGAWSSSKTASTLATALNSETGIDYTKGVKLKLEITTGTSNSTAINALKIYTTTTATAQQTLYPLESYALTLTGLAAGSDVVVRAAGTSSVLGSVDSISGSTWSYVYQSEQAVDIDVIKPGMVLVPFRNLLLTAANSSLPVSQLTDRNYL